MDTRSRSTLANVVAWIALIVSAIALALAWTAYNNASEENLGDMIQDQVRETIQLDQSGPTEMDSQPNDTIDNDATAPTPGTDSNTDDTNTQQDDAVLPENNN